jgi:hypothetical protein
MDELGQLLGTLGPTRSSTLATELQERFGLEAAAARKRVSRSTAPVFKFPIPLLPKRESFLYLLKDRNTERFWINFQRDLRATGSVYGAAIDGVSARGGSVRREDFAVISGAPIAQKGQVAADRVAERLLAAGFLHEINSENENLLMIAPPIGVLGSGNGLRARSIAETVILDGVREWARKLGLASYNSIAIRGDAKPRQVGPFVWDLSGPSYLLPLQRAESQPGFFVADAFADGILDEYQIQYFIRKARMLKACLKGAGVLPVLVAEGFTGPALTLGHKAGVILATPQTLFGRRVGAAIRTLVDTLQNAAAIASSNPDKLVQLIQDLNEIEGAAGNLRGVLFNLMAAHLARRDAASIDIGVRAWDETTGKSADIDILKITNQAASCVAIECKGKQPGGIVTAEEVDNWLKRIPTFRAHFQRHQYLREAKATFELWTSGTFSSDAITLLTEQKAVRTKAAIDWKDGQQVLALSNASKEKAITDALFEHFLRHPLAEAQRVVASEAA